MIVETFRLLGSKERGKGEGVIQFQQRRLRQPKTSGDPIVIGTQTQTQDLRGDLQHASFRPGIKPPCGKRTVVLGIESKQPLLAAMQQHRRT